MNELMFKGKQFVWNHPIALLFRPQVIQADKGVGRASGGRDQAVAMLDHLNDGLLRKAYKSELFPQGPADELAEQPLERVGSDRGARALAQRGRRYSYV